MLSNARFLRSSLTSVGGPLAAMLLAVIVVSLTTDRFMTSGISRMCPCRSAVWLSRRLARRW